MNQENITVNSLAEIIDFFEKHETKGSPNGLILRGEAQKYAYTARDPEKIQPPQCVPNFYGPVPTLFRDLYSEDVKDYGCIYKERDLFYSFIEHYPELRQSHLSPLDWLMLQRHYGMPSRLLDWTRNVLVATYFAVEEENCGKDGVIYFCDRDDFWLRADNVSQLIDFIAGFATVPDMKKLAEYIVKEAKLIDIPYDYQKKLQSGYPNIWSQFDPHISQYIKTLTTEAERMKIEIIFYLIESNPLIIDRPRSNIRVIAQHGLFTIHAGFYSNLMPVMNFIPFPPILKSHSKKGDAASVDKTLNLKVLFISKDAKRKIKHSLERMGIHEASLFPDDMDRFVKYAKKSRSGILKSPLQTFEHKGKSSISGNLKNEGF